MYILSQNQRFLSQMETCELYGTEITGATIYINGTVFAEYPNYATGKDMIRQIAQLAAEGVGYYEMP